MGSETKIEWCHHTMNPWRGCEKVSAGCANCYAETLSHRNPSVLGVWGKNGTRPVAAESYWRQPLAWNRAAEKAGERRRVFCASLADVFEDRTDLIEPRFRLFATIERTPNLDWLLLTKRPENIERLWPSGSVGILGAANIWLGTSVENQEQAEKRIPPLLRVPAAVRFLSVEPLLGPVDLCSSKGGTLWIGGQRGCGQRHTGPGTPDCPRTPHHHHDDRCQRGIDWVIVGGESGPKARPCDVAWVRRILADCRAAGTAAFVKQLGSLPAYGEITTDENGHRFTADRKGGDMSEWPEDLRVREFPR